MTGARSDSWFYPAKVSDETSRTELFAVGSLLVLFVFLVTRVLESPANYDGMSMDGAVAVRMLNLIRQDADVRQILDQRSNYHGALLAFLLVPFLHVFGPSFALVRLFPIGFAVPGLLLTYLFTKKMLGRPAAFMALALLAVDPAYLASVKVGTTTIPHTIPFAMGSLLLLGRWLDTRRIRYLCGGAALLGLGLCIRLWFYWFVVAVGVTGLLFAKEIWSRAGLSRPGYRIQCVMGGGAAFLLGVSMLLLTEASRDYAYLFRYGQELVSSANPHGPRNYLRNLPIVISSFHDMINGRALLASQVGLNPGIIGRLRPGLLWGSVAVCGLALFFRRNRYRRGTLVILSIFASMLLVTPIGHQQYLPQYPPHLVILYPWPTMIIAAALAYAWNVSGRFRGARMLLSALLVLSAGLELRSYHAYVNRLRTVGGRGVWSDTIQDLAAWLKQDDDRRRIYASNEETYSHLLFLSPQKQIDLMPLDRSPYEKDSALPGGGFSDEPFWRHVSGAWLIYHRYGSLMSGLENDLKLFNQRALQKGWMLKLRREFAEDDGTVIYQVYSFESVGPFSGQEE